MGASSTTAATSATTSPTPAATPIEQYRHEASVSSYGLWLFMLSETFLFIAFVSARFYLVGFGHPEDVSLVIGIVLTAILVTSSVTAYLARSAMAADDRARAALLLLVTMALGLAFVAGVGVEWATAAFGADSAYGTTFYVTTGLHTAHVISAIVAVLLVRRLLVRGHFDAQRYWGLSGTVRYWSFVDAIWVVLVFPTFYLL